MEDKTIIEKDRRIAELEHANRQMLDAAEELAIGAMSTEALFYTQSPDDPSKYCRVEPSRVYGIYEEFRRKLEELGDWSRTKEQDRRIAELEIKVARLTAESDSRDRAIDEIHRRAGVRRDGLCGIFGWIDNMKERGGK
jgi:hypothetical protein